jgi:hypothetical protein
MIAAPESAYKARLAAQLMAAACVLASTAPDDFSRRVLARPVFTYGHEFVRWARRAKNILKRHRNFASIVRDLESKLADVEQRDFAPYVVIRDRIAAHRQPFDDTDRAANIQQGFATWNDISDDTVRILAEDVRSIWNVLADAFTLPPLDAFPPVSDDLRQAIEERGFADQPKGLLIGVGSFDETRPNTVQLTQGGDLGERVREIVDSVRAIQILCDLWQVVNGHEPYWLVVAPAIATEACTLTDLTYCQPSTTSERNRHLSLLQLLERDNPQSPAIPVLRRGMAASDESGVRQLRELRNTIGAHIDDKLSVANLTRRLKTFEPQPLNAQLDNLFESLSQAGTVELSLRTLRLIDSAIDGMSRVDDQELIKPY